jgi:hypothetical protein
LLIAKGLKPVTPSGNMVNINSGRFADARADSALRLAVFRTATSGDMVQSIEAGRLSLRTLHRD